MSRRARTRNGGETWWAQQNRRRASLLGCSTPGCLALLVLPLLWWAGASILERADAGAGGEAGRRDASRGVDDPRLAARLRKALGCREVWSNAGQPFESVVDEVVDNLGGQGFRQRVRTVEGWEQIAILAPYDAGDALSGHPALTSAPLRQRLASASGSGVEGRYRVLVIRAQAVVADFAFHSAQDPIRTALVTRE